MLSIRCEWGEKISAKNALQILSSNKLPKAYFLRGTFFTSLRSFFMAQKHVFGTGLWFDHSGVLLLEPHYFKVIRTGLIKAILIWSPRVLVGRNPQMNFLALELGDLCSDSLWPPSKGTMCTCCELLTLICSFYRFANWTPFCSSYVSWNGDFNMIIW